MPMIVFQSDPEGVVPWGILFGVVGFLLGGYFGPFLVRKFFHFLTENGWGFLGSALVFILLGLLLGLFPATPSEMANLPLIERTGVGTLTGFIFWGGLQIIGRVYLSANT